MASAHCSVFSFYAPSPTRRNTLIIVSSKTSNRKNYLRPKILKTLIKPSIRLQPPPLQNIVTPPQEHDLRVNVPTEDTHGENVTGTVEETGELEVLQVSVETAKNNGVFDNVSAKNIFKYGGMYLIGAFVFQTVCYFWNLRNQHSNVKNEDLDVGEREKMNILFGNGNNVEGQVGIEKKVEEIKLMAREVRRIELEKKGEEDEDGDPEIDDEIGIEKEINARLLKLRDKVNSNKDSSAALRLNGGGNSAGDGDVNVNKGKEASVFKKRSKFKSPSTKGMKTPKGFSGTQGRRVSSVKTQDYGIVDGTDPAGKLHEDKQVSQQDVILKNTSRVTSDESEGKFISDESIENLNHENLEEKMETPNMKIKDGSETKSIDNGGFKETSVGMSSPEVIQSRDSRELRTQNPQGFVKGNQDTGPILEKDNLHGINGSSGHGLTKKNSAANEVQVKQANTRTDMWWLNLRYVLVILMERGSDGEGPKGLYSLKLTSKEPEQSGDSYTVAFEDHADANNFCFLLESYFEDLDDFSANVVPMSIQDLQEEIISHEDKVVVVKKKQLQLYAGQVLTDVEMALCSIIEQDQNMP